eukprot:9501738-Pyramimonas_sp.AAC.1
MVVFYWRPLRTGFPCAVVSPVLIFDLAQWPRWPPVRHTRGPWQQEGTLRQRLNGTATSHAKALRAKDH